jgi:hypothetical protein
MDQPFLLHQIVLQFGIGEEMELGCLIIVPNQCPPFAWWTRDAMVVITRVQHFKLAIMEQLLNRNAPCARLVNIVHLAIYSPPAWIASKVIMASLQPFETRQLVLGFALLERFVRQELMCQHNVALVFTD